MRIKNAPDADEWNEDWFTTWQSRKENPNNLVLYEMEENLEGIDDVTINDFGTVKSRDTRKTKSSGYEDGSESGEEVPEIGTLCTMRLKTGERVSRVHYEFTSSLRKSRWRKKYFPKGVFSG